jgi:HK97 family phage portal protein
MGWLSAPRVAKDAAFIVDSRAAVMSLNPFGTSPNMAGVVEQDGSFPNYAATGYGRNELVYACIRYRAESLPQAQVRVYPDNGGPIDDHRLRRLFETPNPVTDEFAFWELSETYINLAGTSFWLVVMGRDGLPSEIYTVRPDLVGVYPDPRNPNVFTWVYRPDPNRPEIAVPIPDAGSPAAKTAPAFMIAVKFPNPNPNDLGQPYFGQPPLRPAARVTTLDNGATDFVDTLLRNHAMPSAIIESEAEITDTIAKRLRQFWQQAFTGRNRGTPAFLQKGMKVNVLGLNLTDLEFPDLRDQSETRICGALDVPPILVGTRVGLTHNAYKDFHEARAEFWQGAMFSEQARFIGPIRSRLLPRFAGVGRRRVSARWDNSGVLALRESEESKWSRGLDAYARGGITRNEFRHIIGLPQVANGDVFVIPAGVTTEPAGLELTGIGEPVAASMLLAAEYGIELTADEATRLELADSAWRG